MRILALLLLSACSSANDLPADAGPDAYGHKTFPEASVEAGPPPIDCDAGATPSANYPAPHPDMPLATTHGGAVLAHPRFVPVVFAAEDRTTDIATFMQKIAASSYWTSIATQYGVGAATATAPIVVNETPPTTITDVEIAAWLQDKLDGTHADFGAADPSSIYVVYYPEATTIEHGGPSCFLFGGYHAETKVGATKVVFSVIARCKDEPMTSITSHELIEAATDPYISTNGAWQGFSDTKEQTSMEAELGDLCEYAGDVTPSDIGYPVQRLWSNAASAAGHDPCQPSSAPYFRTVAAEHIALAAGETTTLDLVAFSDADTNGPWTIKVTSDWSQLADRLDLSLCRTSARNGEHIPLVIKRDPGATQSTHVHIQSILGDVTTYWSVDVGY